MKTQHKRKKANDHKHCSSSLSLSARPGPSRRRKFADQEMPDHYQNGSLLQNADPEEFGLAVSGW